MSDAWMPSLRLKLSRQDFECLPRHPAYKYEHFDGVAHLSPWPRYGHAQLDLERFLATAHNRAETAMRPARADDLGALIDIFAGAFGQQQPFASLDDELLRVASEQSLQRTFSGGDGPVVEAASFIGEHAAKAAGAVLITLLPGGDPTERDSYHWHGPPPPDLWGQHLGQPHLTWIIVDRFAQGNGLGTSLLEHAARVLRGHGYEALWTTFLVGNDQSLLWHWRNGFELLPHPLSKRRDRIIQSRNREGASPPADPRSPPS